MDNSLSKTQQKTQGETNVKIIADLNHIRSTLDELVVSMKDMNRRQIETANIAFENKLRIGDITKALDKNSTLTNSARDLSRKNKEKINDNERRIKAIEVAGTRLVWLVVAAVVASVLSLVLR